MVEGRGKNHTAVGAGRVEARRDSRRRYNREPLQVRVAVNVSLNRVIVKTVVGATPALVDHTNVELLVFGEVGQVDFHKLRIGCAGVRTFDARTYHQDLFCLGVVRACGASDSEVVVAGASNDPRDSGAVPLTGILCIGAVCRAAIEVVVVGVDSRVKDPDLASRLPLQLPGSGSVDIDIKGAVGCWFQTVVALENVEVAAGVVEVPLIVKELVVGSIEEPQARSLLDMSDPGQGFDVLNEVTIVTLASKRDIVRILEVGLLDLDTETIVLRRRQVSKAGSRGSKTSYPEAGQARAERLEAYTGVLQGSREIGTPAFIQAGERHDPGLKTEDERRLVRRKGVRGATKREGESDRDPQRPGSDSSCSLPLGGDESRVHGLPPELDGLRHSSENCRSWFRERRPMTRPRRLPEPDLA